MNDNRKGESGSIPFRSGRFFTVSSKWYFSTREGIDHGPFVSRDEADHALLHFLKDVSSLDQKFIGQVSETTWRTPG